MTVRAREPEVAEGARAPTTGGATPVLTSLEGRVLGLQTTAGNRAVSRLLLARQVATAEKPGPAAVQSDVPADLVPASDDARFRDSDVELLQLRLNWHRGFARQRLLVADGKFGYETVHAVKEFKKSKGIGSKGATVDAETWRALTKAPVSSGAPAGAKPDYDQMVSDGLLDITIGRGFDENGLGNEEAMEVLRGLREVRGFKDDFVRAGELRKAAKRPPPGGVGFWMVRENIGTNAEGAPVHAIVRVLTPAPEFAGQGKATRDAALEGMNEGDAFIYGGHARYGTGPDFDRNYKFTVHWDRFDGTIPEGHAKKAEEYTSSEKLLKDLGIKGSDAQKIAGFEALRNRNPPVIEFHALSGGNIGINPEPTSHKHDFGAHLMRLAAKNQDRPLAKAITERKYRVWLFNGCSTGDYKDAIRSSDNPALKGDQLMMHMTENAIPSVESSEAMLTYLDGLLARESTKALTQRLVKAGRADPYSVSGGTPAKAGAPR